ncbi:MAG: DUF2905 domain-containing protein [Betaproteobacteria bacterium]|nr:MAG: DUF2905 domain-containing protein [Betaproteobacteria bacterium]
MLKWLFTLVLAVLIIGVFTPWLRNIGLRNAGLKRIGPAKQGQRHVPGDFEIERGGKRFSFPIGSTILLSLLASLIFWLLR